MGALPLGRWAGISSEVPPAAPFTGSPTWLQWGFPGKPRSSATRGAFGSPSRQCRGLQSSGHSLWGVLLSPTPSSPARDPQGSTGGCCRRGAKLAFGSPEWACTEAGVQVSFCSTHTHPSPMMWSLLLSTLLMFLSGSLQTWELKVTRKQENQTVVELRGRQGQALLVAPDGSVRCAQPASEKQEPFLLEVHPSGAWTLQQEHSGKYLESDGEDVFCISRRLTSSHMWMPRLAMHVHVVLFNPSLQLYARADAELKRIWVDTPVPYLEECSFILRFRDGVYHLETANHKFLSRSEKLVKTPSAETAFHLTLKPGCLAFFSDRQGRVLYPHGKRGLLCLGHSPVDSGEWFVVQRCPQWVSLRTRTKRYVTVIHESDVFAGSKKVTPMSIFHFEVNPSCKTVQLRGTNDSYLAQRECKNVVANGYCGEPETNFHVLWHCGKICLRASNGCYLGSLPVGLVAARALHPARGKSFWSLTSEKTFETGGKSALNFCLEIRGNNLLAILAPNGYYLRGDREGTLKADGEEVTSETLWEF
ncbi:fascin-3 isoform X3 [Sphaerodactylus townsendi]|uniref:fascin-3 isoform X3 n=1 Tax=Sphaerodactylus townsendi TaxID=933632 RepID=UPI0020265DE2|nr:fascin-3 isoform X3 [Sphaerodactylus townsendi]